MSVVRRFMHRAFTLAALSGVVATVAMLTGPANPAAADSTGPAYATVRIGGRFDLVDDDWDYDPTAYEYFSKTYKIAKGSRETVIIKSRVCAGGEVRGELRLDLTYFSNGHLSLDGYATGDGILLYEGTSCSTTDLDGEFSIYGPGVMAPGASVHEYASVGNVDEGGDDRATVDFTATRVA